MVFCGDFMVKNLILAIGLIFFLGLTLAHPYEYNMESVNSDYYWAKDYYHTYDFDSSSSKTYRFNTYHNGYEYDNFDSYKQSLFDRYHSSIYIESKAVYDYDKDYKKGKSGKKYYRSDYKGKRGSWDYDDSRYGDALNSVSSRSRVFVDDSDYYIYHSRTFGKSYLKKCDPNRGGFIYVSC